MQGLCAAHGKNLADYVCACASADLSWVLEFPPWHGARFQVGGRLRDIIKTMFANIQTFACWDGMWRSVFDHSFRGEARKACVLSWNFEYSVII